MKNTCKHCGELVKAFKCDRCNLKKKLVEMCCVDCHLELAHGVIRNQNIHIISGCDAAFDAPSASWENAVRIVEDKE